MSCEECPQNKTVPQGQGSSEEDCKWGEMEIELETEIDLELELETEN